MFEGCRTYRDVLKNEFEARSHRNSRYSLRAFARDLDLFPSRLSDILKGKQGLSAETAAKLASRLGFNAEESERFITLVLSEDARSPLHRKAAKDRLKVLATDNNYAVIQEHLFRVISDWYHFPILELTLVEDFKPTSEWIAHRLGITFIEAERAIERLLALQLLVPTPKGFKAATTFPATSSEIPSQAIRTFHSQILKLASSALYLQAITQRDFSANMLAIDPASLPEMTKELKQFRRKFEKKYKAKKNKKEVYCLAVQLFSLTKLSSSSGDSK